MSSPNSTFVQSSPRPLGQSLARGAGLKCPSCGEGHMFRAYLKAHDECEHCGEELHHHRADDLPPYLAIVIVGHILIGIMMHLEMVWRIPSMTYLLWLVPIGIVMPLAMMPSIKGAVIGLQWSRRMHGFSEDGDPHRGDS